MKKYDFIDFMKTMAMFLLPAFSCRYLCKRIKAAFFTWSERKQSGCWFHISYTEHYGLFQRIPFFDIPSFGRDKGTSLLDGYKAMALEKFSDMAWFLLMLFWVTLIWILLQVLLRKRNLILLIRIGQKGFWWWVPLRALQSVHFWLSFQQKCMPWNVNYNETNGR